MAWFAVAGGTERVVLIGLACLTVALALLLLWSLRRVEKLVRNVDSVFVWQHRRRTPVATIAGLVTSLEKGLEQGGLTPDQRRAIYRAIDEQLALFYSLDETFRPVEDDQDGGPHGRLGDLLHRLKAPEPREIPESLRRVDVRAL